MDALLMAAELRIDRNTGDIRIGDVTTLRPNQTKSSIEPMIANLLKGSRDHGNGFEWLDLRDLTFGGEPAGLSLCFHNGRLEQASWNVQLPGAPMESGWPTRDAIEHELLFVRGTLTQDMNIQPGKMPWGEVWSSFDAKGFLAANGLRYRHA